MEIFALISQMILTLIQQINFKSQSEQVNKVQIKNTKTSDHENRRIKEISKRKGDKYCLHFEGIKME